VFFVVLLVICALSLASCGDDGSSPPASDHFDADRAFADLEAQVDFGPRPAGSPESRELVSFLVKRLEQAGVDGVAVQRPYRNVVATIPGTGEGTVVVGAHHDTVDIPGFVGANDGASGVAVVLELARVLAAEAPLDGPSVAIALFDAEEARSGREFADDGTRGSRQYVAYAKEGEQGSPPIDEITSMILFDMVGDCDLQIPHEEISDKSIYDRFAEAADETNGSAEPFVGEAIGVSDDHVPFLKAGVPSLDIIDFTFGGDAPPGTYWHTAEDALGKVCPESLDSVGEPAVRVLDGS
jgi:glutaminyl-peptide cyclotransferase